VERGPVLRLGGGGLLSVLSVLSVLLVLLVLLALLVLLVLLVLYPVVQEEVDEQVSPKTTLTSKEKRPGCVGPVFLCTGSTLLFFP
jgi:hypothetical protein